MNQDRKGMIEENTRIKEEKGRNACNAESRLEPIRAHVPLVGDKTHQELKRYIGQPFRGRQTGRETDREGHRQRRRQIDKSKIVM